MPVKHVVDNAAERFGSKVSLANLAAFTFEGCDSDRLNIYQADSMLARDWPFEVDSIEMEYALGVSATFKDGSRLHVSAWGDCCRPGDPNYGNCHWCGGRY